MNKCIFCMIANKEIECKKIYEDDIVLAYLDISPDSDGHTLVIPKKHYTDINDINFDVHEHIYKASKNIMSILKDKLNCDGFSLLQNNGSIQEVKHFHLHIKPYYNDKQTIKIIKDNSKISDLDIIYKKITK